MLGAIGGEKCWLVRWEAIGDRLTQRQEMGLDSGEKRGEAGACTVSISISERRKRNTVSLLSVAKLANAPL